MRVLRNKKASNDEGGSLVWLLVLLVVAVVVVMGITGYWKVFFGPAKLLPQDVSSASFTCANIGKNLGTDFCDFKSVNLEGKSMYASCPYVWDVAKKYLNESQIGFNRDARSCSADGAYQFCLSRITQAGYEKIVVNGKTCQDRININCSSLNGQMQNSPCADGKDLGSQVIYPAEDVKAILDKVKYCCSKTTKCSDFKNMIQNSAQWKANCNAEANGATFNDVTTLVFDVSDRSDVNLRCCKPSDSA